MTGSYLLDPLVFLIQTLFGLYIAVVAIRFLLQWVRADFYNPLSQFVVRITTPVLRPLRRVIPGYGGLDLAALVLIWLLSTVELGLMALVVGLDRSLFGAFAWAIPSMVELYNPATALLDRLTAPVMRPAQRVIRPIGGIDLAPMLVMIGLVLLNMLLIPPLKWLVASPF